MGNEDYAIMKVEDSIEEKFKWLIMKFSLATLIFLVSIILILLSMFLGMWHLNVIGVAGLLGSFGLLWFWFILPTLVRTISLAKEMAIREYMDNMRDSGKGQETGLSIADIKEESVEGKDRKGRDSMVQLEKPDKHISDDID